MAGLLASGLLAAAAESPLWLRYPAISPDGTKIVFSYRGDLYLVPAQGGQAIPITLHEAHEFMPVWSPNGEQIAFASDRHGNFDVFVMPANGGPATRLTYHSADDYPTDFSPDGQAVLFHSNRLDAPGNVQFPSRRVLPELYRAPLAGGPAVQVLTTPAQDARYDRTGRRLLYHDRKGYENEWRKHHVSSIARDVWLFDATTKRHEKLTEFEGEDRNPVWSPDEDEVYFLSEKSGSFNVWKFPLNQPAQLTQVTFHEQHPVRFLTASRKGDLCYSFNGEIYLQPARAKKPRGVKITLAAGPKRNEAEFVTFSSEATEMDLSSNGKEIVFVVRGEIFVTSVDHKVTKRITNTPEQERSVSFSPDGRKILYAGERGGSWNLYQASIARDEELYFYGATIIAHEPLLATPAETFQPRYSPDGKEVAYLEERTTLKVLNLETKATRLILPGDRNYSYTDGDQWFDWSPDGKWFLVNFLDRNRWSSEVGLIAAQGRPEVINLTRSGYADVRPQWMMEGKMLIWSTDRHGMRSHGSWGSNYDVYGMFFTREAFDRFRLSKDELELLKEREKKEKEQKDKDKKEEAKKNEKAEPDKEPEKEPTKTEALQLDLANIEDRVARLTIHSSDLADAVLTPDGEKLLYLSKFEKGYDLWLHKPREKETRLLAKLGTQRGRLKLDAKATNVFVLSDGKIAKINLDSGKNEAVTFVAEMILNTPAERAYLFEHVWRQVLKKFYVEDLHGVDWEFYKREYARFLPHIENNWDFAEMLSEMLGELNASHTGAGHRPSPKSPDLTASLGFFADAAHDGNGVKIAEVLDKGPLQKAGTRVKSGVIIEQIDGVEITPRTDPAALLNRKADKPTLLALFDPLLDQRWEETVKPITLAQEDELLYQRWIKGRREATERLSGGRIGYVHIRSMGDASFREFYSELLGRNTDKEAVVVDTRFNGGGWLHDDLANLLGGNSYFSYVPRGNEIGKDPMEKWLKPSILLVSESNYSNAHMFPLVYKKLDLGEVVGMPVPGTGTAVWWETQQDRTLYFGIPQVGVRDWNGNYLENQQLSPDHLVNNDPESVAAGRDRQLERAVELLRQKLAPSAAPPAR